MTRSALPMRDCASPNFGDRAAGTPIEILLLHYTGMGSADAACRWLCDPRSQVSCHYLIDEDGAITRLVPEEKRAWHAGASSWQGKTDINSRSIGIEIHNPGHGSGYPAFPEAQMAAVIALCNDILHRYAIAPTHVLAHSDVAPRRKIDPGEKFDWARLYAAGIGHWTQPAPVTQGAALALGNRGWAVRDLQQALAVYGYDIEPNGTYDQRTVDVVAAFQRHFRQAKIDGKADPSTIQTLQRLANAAPLARV